MKINFVGTANLKDNYLTLPFSLEGKIKDQFKGNPLNKERWHEAFGAGAAEVVRHKQILFEHWDRQKNEPIELSFSRYFDSCSYWIYKGCIVSVSLGTEIIEMEDLKSHIKHYLLKRRDKVSKIRKEVDRLERFEKFTPIYRKNVPEDVRMYVWRRDNGKCIQCGSNRNLEFDHIIPVSAGGSNTERNIQLLCTDCNKKKSNKI